MAKILSDHDVEGQLLVLLRIWASDEWRGLWEELDGSVSTFRGLGIPRELPDDQVWQFCQDHGYVLLTGNRNSTTPDSLEATIQARNRPESLPVFTIADADRVMLDRAYAEAVAVKVLDFLQDLENLRGTRRLFVP
jgi:hypothetical protein